MSIFLKDNIGRNRLAARQVLSDPVLFLAFGFGSGLVKKAPGTLGTLAAVPVFWIFSQFGFMYYSGLTVLALVAGIGICGDAANKLGEHDFGGIVWDEVAGFLVTMWWMPLTWQTLVVGFALFRLFDIIKPWPIRWVDRRVSGGFGIMLDDILAGLLAAGVMSIALNAGWL
ncbi:MAG: phosphatidylglycerophosphatase A family protein [Gammaproteobacteria bacterium]